MLEENLIGIDELLDSSLEIVEDPRDDLISDEEYQELSNYGIQKKGAQWRENIDVGDTGFGDSQWDEGATIEEVQGTAGTAGLQGRRSTLQPWQDQLANAVTQAVVGEIIGGTIEGVGYLLDWQGMANLANGSEKEYTNWFSNIGKGIREKTQDLTQIHERSPGEMDLFDSGYWFKNSVSVASTLSMMLPSMAAAKGLGMLGRGASKLIGKGMARGAKKIGRELSEEAFDVATKMGVQAEWMTSGISEAVVSRHIENSMEASGTFEEIYEERLKQVNPKTGAYFTEGEARQSAANAASENYKNGWAMLAQDMLQYLSIGKVFNPVTRQMEVARKFTTASKAPAWLKKAGAVTGTFASEAGEEGYQHFIASKAALNSELNAGLISEEEYKSQLGEVMSSDEAMTSMLFGGLGGSVFQMVGPKANQLFKSKSKKEFEENAGQLFSTALENRAKIHAALQVQKNNAEEFGTEEEIQAAQDDIILNMVLDGIDTDNVEMTMEAMKNEPEMTAEEIAKFKEETDLEWDPAVAKAGAERALEVAARVKEIHYRNRNKAKNKNVAPSIVQDMTRIEFQNEEYGKQITKIKKDNKKRIDDIQFDSFLKPMDNFREKKDLEAKIAATKEVIGRTEERLAKSKDEDSIKTKKDLIKSHNSNLLKMQNRVSEIGKEDIDPKTGKTNRDADQIEANKKGEVVYNDGLMAEIAGGYLRELQLNDAITENQNSLKRLNDKAFQKQKVVKDGIRGIKEATDISALENYQAGIESGQVQGYENAEDKKKIDEAIKEKIAELKEKELKDNQAIEEEKIKTELLAKAAAENAKLNSVGETVTTPVDEAVEDTFFFEEALIEEELQDKAEEHTEVLTGNGKTVSPLDDNENTSGPYREWIHNGFDKIGTVITYASHTRRGFHRAYQNRKTPAGRAYNTYNDLLERAKKGEKITVPQNVYDNLPIAANVGEVGGSIYTVMPSYPRKTKQDGPKRYAEKLRKYQENYAAERKHIIDAMLANEGKAETTIKHTGGGELQIQPSVKGVKAENNIKDLKQVKAEQKKGNPPRILFSDIDGALNEIDESKSTLANEFRKIKLVAGNNSEGQKVPYKGGLFLVLKKADGTPFPVRLNLKYNTKDQSEVLADLLLDVSVPGKIGEKTKYSLTDPLSFLDQDLQDRIKLEMGPEIEMLGGVSSDPTLTDIINAFVFVNESTQGSKSQLFMKSGELHFGEMGNSISAESALGRREELVTFLTEVKRRQFSIKMWNDTENYPGYRDFMMDNGIINTNVVVGQDEFQSSQPEEGTGKVARRVQIYMAPLAPVASDKPAEVVQNKESVTKTVVDSSNSLPSDPSTDVKEKTEPAPFEVNAAIKKKFKGILYLDGKFVQLQGMKEVTDKETLKELNKIKDDLFKDFNDKKEKAKKVVTEAKEKEIASEMTEKETSLKDAKDQLDFEIERLDDIDTSEEANIVSKDEVAEKKRQARERYVQKVQEIKKEYAPAPVTPAPSEKQTITKKIFDVMGNEEMGYDVMELTEDGLITDGQGSLSKDEAEEYAAKLQYDANKAPTTQTSEVETNEAKIKELRDQEQNELLDAIPNAEKYLTNGKVDKTKIKNKKYIAKFEKIYNKYDKLISPLMVEETSPANETSTTTIERLKEIGFVYPFSENDKSGAYYENHPEYKITIDGTKVTTFPWSESTSEANISDNSQKVTSGKAVDDSNPTVYKFDTAAEARLKAEELSRITPKADDTKISKKDSKDLPLTNNRKVRKQSNSSSLIVDTGASRRRPRNTEEVTDDDVKPKDEKKNIECTPGGGQMKIDF